MTYRICAAIHQICRCSDAEAMPCLAKLIEDYLVELRDDMLGIDPDDGLSLSFRRRDIVKHCQTFPTMEALRADWERSTGLKWGEG